MAASPSARPEQIETLSLHRERNVHRAARRNPSLPPARLRAFLEDADPDAWANPQADLLLAKEDDHEPWLCAAVQCAEALLDSPRPDLTAALAPRLGVLVQRWWQTRADALGMVGLLGDLARCGGQASKQHRRCARVACLCVRSALPLLAHEREEAEAALDEIERWASGDETIDILAASEPSKRVGLSLRASVVHSQDPEEMDSCDPETERVLSIAEALLALSSLASARSAGAMMGSCICCISDAFASSFCGDERYLSRAVSQRALADLVRSEVPLCPLLEHTIRGGE